VETYPAEYYGWWLSSPLKGKRKEQNRKKVAPDLRAWADAIGVKLTPDLERLIEEGFRDGGDDAFDAVVGLLAIVTVLLGGQSSEPTGELMRTVEGWILGQNAGFKLRTNRKGNGNS
jgi:hypothetical protein